MRRFGWKRAYVVAFNLLNASIGVELAPLHDVALPKR
jgi:hypothetical protein